MRALAGLALWAAISAHGTEPANPRFTGNPFIQTWKAEDTGASPVNWRVVIHPNGFVYIGNNFGVLEFDGARWRLFPLAHEGPARALIVDPSGALWAAGNSEITRFKPDGAGGLRAEDMTPQIPLPDRVFGTLNRALSTQDGVYFAGERRIFLFRTDGAVRVWRTEGTFAPIFALGDAVYSGHDRQDIVRLGSDGSTRILFTVDELPSPTFTRVYSVAPGRGGGWILLSHGGPFRWTGDESPPTPLSAASADFFRHVLPRSATVLSDGRFAIGTVSGIVILTPDGAVEQRIDTAHGLPVDTINSLAEDRDGGLWVAMQSGISRIQIESPFAVHGIAQGLDGGPRRLATYQGRLYVAYGGGVAVRDPASGVFHRLAAIEAGANRPVVVAGQLLVSAGLSLREVGPDGSAALVAPVGFLPLIESRRHPRTLLAGDSDGLWILPYRRDPPAASPGTPHPAHWSLLGRVRNLPAGVIQIFDSNDGYVWTVTDTGGLWRVDFRRGLGLDAPAELFDADRGVPPAIRRDHVELFFVGSDLYAASAAWFVRFDSQAGRFVPAQRDLRQIDGSENEGDDVVWLHTQAPVSQVVRLAAPWNPQVYPAAALQGMVLNSLFHEEATHTLWIAAQGSLFSMDLDWHPAAPPRRPSVVIRKLTSARGEVLATGDTGRAAGRPLLLTREDSQLHFEFAAPVFATNYLGTLRTRYRTLIEGLDADWSPWALEPFRDVTTLPFGDYRFKVQALLADGRQSDSAVLAFRVEPPWWRTLWADAAYGLLALAAVFLLLFLRTRALRRRAARLEALVEERTAQLAEKAAALESQNAELTRLRQLETKERIAARLAEEKARLEVLRYQLNPHFLFNALTSICSYLPHGEGGARDIVERLTEFCQLTLFRPADDEKPTLGQEMRMLSAYLDIEQSRWGELLEVKLSLEDSAADCRLPPFLLLPLVENALKYGRATSPHGMHIRIGAWTQCGELVIEVANAGHWVAPAAQPTESSFGIGLDNLRQRLARYYPGAHRFITESSGGWVRCRLHLALLPAPLEPAVV